MMLHSQHALRTVLVTASLVGLLAGLAQAQPEDGLDGQGELQPDAEDIPEMDAAPEADGDVEAGGDAGVAQEPASAAVGYKKGFFIKSADDRFELHVQGRVQGRFAAELDSSAADTEEEAYFQIPRARLSLSGHAFTDRLKYKFQTDYGKGNTVLKDFYLDYKLGDSVIVRAGQWKRPFARQQLNSSSRLELVDRAITDKAFAASRDIGVGVHNNYTKSPELEWVVGVFNAQAADKPVLDAATGKYSNYPALLGPALAARVGINRGGIKGYSEADLEGGPLRFAAAASVVADLDADDTSDGAVLAVIDFIVKNHGMSASAAAYISTTEGADGFFDQSRNALGFHAQLGYMLAGKHQVAARYAMVNRPDPDAPDENLTDHEIVVGHSLYEFKHNFKWQTDVGLLAGAGKDLGDVVQVRSQVQLSF